MLALNAYELGDAVDLGRRAVALAVGEDAPATLAHALNTVGTAKIIGGQQSGLDELLRSFELATAAGLEEHIGRAMIHLADVAAQTRNHALADRYLPEALDYCGERGLDLWLRYLNVYSARIELDRGRWSQALDAIPPSVVDPGTPLPRIVALVVLGLVRARRGDPESSTALDEAGALAEAAIELQWALPVAAARAEAAWLVGDFEAVRRETDEAFAAAADHGLPWWSGELACWRRRAGVVDVPPPVVAEPWLLELGGEWDRPRRGGATSAVRTRRRSRLPAGTTMRFGAPTPCSSSLGAAPAASIVARRLRGRGVRGISRGPRSATRVSPAGRRTAR